MSFKKITSYVLLFFLALYGNTASIFVYALSPDDIVNKVFFLDAQDTDNDGNSVNEPSNNSQITDLIDKFNSNTGSQIISPKRPLYEINSINSYPSIKFDGNDDLLNLKDNLNISLGTNYKKKSYAMIIKTGNDVNTFQTIYDEGTKDDGFSIQIDQGALFLGGYSTSNGILSTQRLGIGGLNTNEVYTIIYTYNNGVIEGYLNGISTGSLGGTLTVETHGACTFETNFNCAMYSTGGTLSIGATKNDTVFLRSRTQVTGYERDFFKGHIGEISSFNHVLTYAQVQGLNDYLFEKWGFDTTAPVIDSTNFNNNKILPGGTHDIVFNYSDTGVGATGIDTTTANPYLEKWNSSNSTWENITSTGLNAGTITISSATYPTNNLDYGKYRFNFNISDNAGNTSSNSQIVFYIDKPEMVVSKGSIDIGTLNHSSNTFGDTLTVTVKTIGAPFRIKIKKNQKLENNNSSDFIPYYDGTVGIGYDKNNDGNLSDYNDHIVGQEVKNINTNGDLNTYNYTVKMLAIVDLQQAAGDYTGKIDLGIEFNY